MKRNIKMFLGSLLLGAILLAPLGLGQTAWGAAGRTGGRPFSWYYPYNYQYYYPQRYNSCYWVYVNGEYVYQCR